MLKTSKLLTITVPKLTYKKIQKSAKEKNITVSGLLRQAFESYVEGDLDVYSNKELQRILQRDKLSPEFQKDLKKLLPPLSL